MNMQSSVLPVAVPPPVNTTGQRNKGINTATKVLGKFYQFFLHTVIYILNISYSIMLRLYILSVEETPFFSSS